MNAQASDAPKVALYYLVLAAVVSVGASAALYLTLQFDVRSPAWWRWLWDYYQAMGTLPLPVLVIGGGTLFVAVLGIALCPWSLAVHPYGDAAWAKLSDLRKMKPRVLDRRGIVLGRFGGLGPFGRRTLMSDAPLSGLVVAPAGTGKTVGVIVPSILRSDGASLVVNDPKGELYELTAGYRARLGRVLRIEWNAGASRSVCWNPLGLENLPADGPGRGDLVDRMVTLLVEGEESNFFVSSPRAGLSAWLLYQVYACEAEGVSATLAGSVHALAALGQSEEAQAAAEEGVRDLVAFDLEALADRAEVDGWPQRIASGLRALAAYDFKTRSNVIGTINASMRLFLNDNVAETTSRTDFGLDDLRGRDGKPVTVYLVVPAFDQEAFGKVSALLIESATRRLTQKRPSGKDRAVRFVLDEVAFLPPMKAVSMGPAITRGYSVSFIFACQDFGQLRDKWGPGGLDNIITNTAFKVVLTQNNQETAKRVSDAIGQYTRERESASRSKTPGKLMGSKSVSKSLEGAPLVRPEEIMSLPMGRQIVLVQNYANRPIACRSGFYLKERALRRRAKVPAPAVKGAA